MDPDELYCLPLDRFVAERDALAKSLRADGRREEAADVAKLPKPSVAAWAVNQVVRAQPKRAEALWAAGDEVLDTQARLVDGAATGPELREAIERQRAALEPLAEAARGLVTGGAKFLAEQHVQAVVETLHAASVDPAAREDVAAARTAKTLRLTGLEAMASGPAARRPREAHHETAGGPKPRGGGAAKRTGDPDAARARLTERKQADAEAEAAQRAEEKERAARRRELQRALARAERDRDAARSRVQAAVKARDEAAIRVEAAEADLARAENARADAHAELEQAEDAVDRARTKLDDDA